MTVPQEVRLARHAVDLDDDGHDAAAHVTLADAGNHFMSTDVEGALAELGSLDPTTTGGDMIYKDPTTGLGDDLAAGITSAVSSTGDGSAANITDGNDATFWKSSGNGPGNTVRIDLGTAQAVDRFRVRMGVAFAGEAHTFVIESSPDDSTWTTYQTVTATGLGQDTGVVAIVGAAGAYRYWRIRDTVAGSNWWGIYTFSLYIFLEGPALARLPIGTEGQVLEVASGIPAWGDAVGGVTSVAMTVPAEFSVSGSPITSTGTLAITKVTETANTVWAGPTAGSAAQPAFRALVASDIPAGVGTTDHEHIDAVAFSGDGSTTAFELPAAPFDEWSVKAHVAGLRTAVTLSGYMLTTMTFGSAPASGTDNVLVDIVAAVA